MKNFDELLKDIDTYNLEYTIPKNLSKLKKAFKYANGCGSNIKVPKTIYFINIESACIIHDIEWTLSKSYAEILEANENFDNNLKKICDPQSNFVTILLRRLRIAKYVSAVELVGTSSYAKTRGFI